MTDLARKYRPRTFPDVVGQRPVAATLYRMVVLGNVPQALLFAGTPGSGKTTTGRILAAALNCAADKKPCGGCASCTAILDGSGRSPAVLEEDAASNGGVAEVRKLRDLVQYGVPGQYRVVLLDEAHAMTDPAFQALLKVLEEPPPNTVFVLLTTEPSAIPATVVTRCMDFTFSRIPLADIKARLEFVAQAEGFAAESQLLAFIAERANGCMRDGLKLLDQAASAGITTYGMYAKLMGDADFAPGLLDAMASGRDDTLFSRLDEVLATTGDYGLVPSRLVRCLTEITVLQAPGSIERQGEALAVRQALAVRLAPAQVHAALRVLWQLSLTRQPDPRAAVELAVHMCRQVLGPKPRTAPAPAAQPSGDQPATIDQLNNWAKKGS